MLIYANVCFSEHPIICQIMQIFVNNLIYANVCFSEHHHFCSVLFHSQQWLQLILSTYPSLGKGTYNYCNFARWVCDGGGTRSDPSLGKGNYCKLCSVGLQYGRDPSLGKGSDCNFTRWVCDGGGA